MAIRYKVKKNDQVLVISGRDKGKRGRAINVMTTKGKLLVEGVAIIRKAIRPNRQRGIAGGIVEKGRHHPRIECTCAGADFEKANQDRVSDTAGWSQIRVSRKTGSDRVKRKLCLHV